MKNIKSKLLDFFKIKKTLFLEGIIGWIITSLYSVFFMLFLLGVVLFLGIYYYNSIQMVQPTVKQIRIKSNEDISWFQFDIRQNASESLQEDVNGGISFAFKYTPKDVYDSIFTYETVKKKDSISFIEKKRAVKFKHGYGVLPLLNKCEIPEGIDSSMNYKRNLFFEIYGQNDLMNFAKIDAHVFPDNETMAIIDSCSPNKVSLSYYTNIFENNSISLNIFNLSFKENILSTNDNNPYIYYNIQFEGFGDSSQGTLTIGYKDYKNDDWNGFVSNPLKYEYIYPEPSLITPNHIIYDTEKIKEILVSGITIHAVDMAKKMRSEKIVFLHTVLFGMCLTYVIQIITYLLGLWRDKILRVGFNGVAEQKKKILIITALTIIIVALFVSFV